MEHEEGGCSGRGPRHVGDGRDDKMGSPGRGRGPRCRAQRGVVHGCPAR